MIVFQSPPTDVETTVKALLDAAHLKMSDEEFQLFVRIYPPMRAGLTGCTSPRRATRIRH
jgi:hypothetical protein